MKKNRTRLMASLFVALFALTAVAACEGEDEGPEGISNSAGASHYPGKNCASCHNVAYSGTIYSDASASSKVKGKKIVVTEADGNTITMTSDSSGNFWSKEGNPGGGYSAKVEGNSVNMNATTTIGGCNSSGCHDGSTTPRIYAN